MKHRCPWCGEYIGNEKGISMLTSKCPFCCNKYKSYRKSIRYLIPFSICLIALVVLFNLGLPVYSYYFIGLMGINEIILRLCPYIKDSDHYVIQKRQYAKISLYSKEVTHIKFPKLRLVENQIFTICFINENNTPISHMICVSTESIHWEKQNRRLACIFAFLPLGQLDKEYSTGTRFYLFYNNKKIGEGFLGEKLVGFNQYS